MSKFSAESERAKAALFKAIQDRHPDPYVYVASVVWGIKEEDVSEELRQVAKRDCYFHLYDNRPPQLTSFEAWESKRSGLEHTVMVRGRHYPSLQEMVAYVDCNGLVWFRSAGDFAAKFTKKPDPLARVDLGRAELKVVAMTETNDGESDKAEAQRDAQRGAGAAD